MRANDVRTKMRKRRGSSLLLVIATIAVLLSFWSMSYRMTASLIRVQSSFLTRQKRSVQSIHAMTALDRALTLVEVSKPTERKKYIYKLDLVLPDATHKFFTITYTPYDSPADIRDHLDGDLKKGWTVNVSPEPWVGSGNVLALPVIPVPPDKPIWSTSPQ